MKRLPPTRPLALATLAATLLCAVAVTNPVPASAADSSTANPAHVANVATRMPIDERIKSLNERLQITAEQESLWQPVAQVMRENAGAMDALRQSRLDKGDSMSALDDLHAYGDAVDARADGIKKLIPPFEALYRSMSDTQKHNADRIFRNDTHKMTKKG